MIETWNFATEQEWVAAAREEFDSDVEPAKVVDGLTRRIRQLLDYRSAPRPTGSRELPPDGRDEALARVLAALASRDKSVARFRREVLRSRLVRPPRVAEWVRRRAHKEGPPTFRRIVPVEGDGTPLPDSVGLRRGAARVSGRLERGGARPSRSDSRGRRSLAIEEAVQVAGRGIQLQQEPDGAAFILSGRMPSAPRTRAGFSLAPRLPARSFVRMDVNPRVSPREVADLYATMRERAYGAHGSWESLSCDDRAACRARGLRRRARRAELG